MSLADDENSELDTENKKTRWAIYRIKSSKLPIDKPFSPKRSKKKIAFEDIPLEQAPPPPSSCEMGELYRLERGLADRKKLMEAMVYRYGKGEYLALEWAIVPVEIQPGAINFYYISVGEDGQGNAITTTERYNLFDSGQFPIKATDRQDEQALLCLQWLFMSKSFLAGNQEVIGLPSSWQARRLIKKKSGGAPRQELYTAMQKIGAEHPDLKLKEVFERAFIQQHGGAQYDELLAGKDGEYDVALLRAKDALQKRKKKGVRKRKPNTSNSKKPTGQ